MRFFRAPLQLRLAWARVPPALPAGLPEGAQPAWDGCLPTSRAQETVNMTPEELERWLGTEQSRQAVQQVGGGPVQRGRHEMHRARGQKPQAVSCEHGSQAPRDPARARHSLGRNLPPPHPTLAAPHAHAGRWRRMWRRKAGTPPAGLPPAAHALPGQRCPCMNRAPRGAHVHMAGPAPPWAQAAPRHTWAGPRCTPLGAALENTSRRQPADAHACLTPPAHTHTHTHSLHTHHPAGWWSC